MLLLLPALCSCALTEVSLAVCSSDQECVDALGVGALCNPTGYCAPCDSTEQCIDAFGNGSVCATNAQTDFPELQFCEDIELHPRCDNDITRAIFDNWDIHRESYLIGDLFDHSAENGDQANLAAMEIVFDELDSRQPLESGNGFARISCSYENDANNLMSYTQFVNHLLDTVCSRCFLSRLHKQNFGHIDHRSCRNMIHLPFRTQLVE